MKKIQGVFKNIFRFYYDGFSNLSSWGRKSWLIILIKLFIMFAILKVFFFNDFLESKFKNDTDKGNYVRDQLINYQ